MLPHQSTLDTLWSGTKPAASVTATVSASVGVRPVGPVGPPPTRARVPAVGVKSSRVKSSSSSAAKKRPPLPLDCVVIDLVDSSSESESDQHGEPLQQPLQQPLHQTHHATPPRPSPRTNRPPHTSPETRQLVDEFEAKLAATAFATSAVVDFTVVATTSAVASTTSAVDSTTSTVASTSIGAVDSTTVVATSTVDSTTVATSTTTVATSTTSTTTTSSAAATSTTGTSRSQDAPPVATTTQPRPKRVRQKSCGNEKKIDPSLKRRRPNNSLEERLATMTHADHPTTTKTTTTTTAASFAHNTNQTNAVPTGTLTSQPPKSKPADNVPSRRLGAHSTTTTTSTRRVSSSPDTGSLPIPIPTIQYRKQHQTNNSPRNNDTHQSLSPSGDGTVGTTGNTDRIATLRCSTGTVDGLPTVTPPNGVPPTTKDVNGKDVKSFKVTPASIADTGSRDRDRNRNHLAQSPSVPELPSGVPEDTGAESQSPPLPSMTDVASKCWRCLEELKPSSNEEPCLYATHLHVVLDVRVCSVCAEAVAAIENSNDVEEKSSFCAGCAIGEDDCYTTFFLCDTDACQRVFCRHCVAQSWGGGEMGWQKTRLLQATEDSWYCPGCRPPNPLTELKQMVANDLKCQASQDDRNADFLLDLLARAETAKDECETDREETSRNPEENAAYLEALRWHDDRLSDFIVGLLDELDTKHELSPAVCYMYLGMPIPTPGVCSEPNNASDNESVGNDVHDGDSEEEPDWVRRAHRQVDTNRKKDERKTTVLALPKEAYEKDDYDGVEDLGSEDIVTGDITVSIRPGFRRGIRPSEAMIRVASANVEELAVSISAVVNDVDDQNALLIENQWAIGSGARQEFKRPRLLWSPPNGKATPRVLLAIPNRTSDSKDQEEQIENFTSEPFTAALATTHESMLSSEANECASGGHDSTFSWGSTTGNSVANLSSGEVTSKTATPKTPESSKANIIGGPNEISECVIPVASPAHLNQPNKALKLCAKGECVHDKPNVRTVAVRARLSKMLKSHQREGVQFMWDNCFSDFAWNTRGDETQIGGCILAHSMGLGKSLSAIALLHTVMTNRAMVSRSNDGSDDPLIRKVLLVVPVNTVTNWEHEFSIWQEDLMVTNLNEYVSERREARIKEWSTSSSPGILLATEGILKTCENVETYLKPDVLVMDEVHTMIRNPKNAAFKMLKALSPRRIIGLTGSPFQNNLAEYFHMMNFLRPNVLGHSNETTFLREYAKPIADGMASNASPRQARVSLEKAKELNKKFDPFVHRVDSKVLKQDLPPISQVVLHVRQSRMQAKLYRAHKRSLDIVNSGDVKSNFLKQYNMLRPIHSHPGSLLFSTDSKRQKGEEKDEIGDWWASTVNEEGKDKVKGVMHGYKITLLFHLLASAQLVGDKVVIFANSLATLNYIEYALTMNWIEHVPSLESSFPDLSIMLWEKSRDFFRIDGAVSAADRGDIIKQFEESKTAKVMLLSKAGGIGINLTSANRIVIIDQHFNPTISSQAISRVFRYGQTKPVFCYTMLTQGTTEEKVYGRCVNKTGIALRIIDSKTIDRCFTNEELQDLSNNLTWVQCDDCDKWRVLLGKVPDDKLPDKWTCLMNLTDKMNNNCDASEKDQTWYENYERKRQQSLPSSPTKSKPESEVHDEQSESIPYDDTILQHILSVTEEGKSKTLVCDHHFQEALMATASLEITLQEMADSGEESECPLDPSGKSKVVSVEDTRSTPKKSRLVKPTPVPEMDTHFQLPNAIGSDVEQTSNSKTDTQRVSRVQKTSYVDKVLKQKSHSSPVIKTEQMHAANFGEKTNYSSLGTNAGASSMYAFDSEEEEPTDV